MGGRGWKVHTQMTHKHAHTTHTHTHARTIRRYLAVVVVVSYLLVCVALSFSFVSLAFYLVFAYSMMIKSKIIGCGGGDTDDVDGGVVCVYPKRRNECSCYGY